MIESGGGTTSLTVRDSTGVGSAPDNSGTSLSKIQRYYNGSTPIVDWESELDDTDLYDASDDAVGECYNDAAFTSNVTIDGGGGIGLTTVKLTAPAGERHDGTDGTGARIVKSSAAFIVAVGSPAVTIEFLEIDSGGGGSTLGLVQLQAAGDNCTVQNMVLLGSRGTINPVSGVVIDNGVDDFSIHNCIIYDIEHASTFAQDGRGIRTGTTAGTSTVINCTVHDVFQSNAGNTADALCFSNNDDAQLTLQNCIGTDPTNAGSGVAECYDLDPPSNATMDHNLASDATASGTGSLDNGVANDIFVSTTSGMENLRLKSGAAVDPIDAGVDLGTSPAGVNIDIHGRDRDAKGDTWDIGADEFVLVLTSIGQGTTHDENAVISAVSGAGPTYTVTIAANSSVNGDALFDEHATPRKYLIESGGGTTSLIVRDSTGVGSAPDNSGTSLSAITRYYNGSTPMVDWESELDDTDLYGASDDVVGECYNDAEFISNVTINGGGTVGLTTAKLTVPSVERHDGIEGTGARVVANAVSFSLAIASPAITIEWIEIDSNKTGNLQQTINISSSGDNFTVRNSIIHGAHSASTICAGIRLSTSVDDFVLTNLIIYDIEQSGTVAADVRGLSTDGTSGTSSVMNCTVHDVSISNAGASQDSACFHVVDDDQLTLQNCIGTDPTNAGSGVAECYDLDPPSFAIFDHNLASDTTASGTGSLDSGVSGDIFVSTTGGSEDLHLKSGAAVDPIDAGVDKVTTPTGVNFDIDDDDRDALGGAWDMGADEFVSVPTLERAVNHLEIGAGVSNLSPKAASLRSLTNTYGVS